MPLGDRAEESDPRTGDKGHTSFMLASKTTETVKEKFVRIEASR
jgi:hypothetical protein